MSFSYIDQMDRISNDELLEGLAGYGLFADKIPPFLTAESFFNFAQNNLTWEKIANFKNKILLLILLRMKALEILIFQEGLPYLILFLILIYVNV
ncbi:hypothetical protein GV391_10640 [Neisseria meningitidis]|nr:hypothetical protein [Neisseria meningitidis]